MHPTGTLRRPAAVRPESDRLGDGYHDVPDGSRPAGEPSGAGDRPRRSRRGRAAAARLRKSRRRVYRWGIIAIVVCIIAAVVSVLATRHSPKPALYVTSLLPGEFKSAPDACGSVSTTVLNQYLPGPGRTSTSELSGPADSECSFTLDRKPAFLVLEVSAQAYQPFAAATGAGSPAGSASANAQQNYAQVQQDLAKPSRNSPLKSPLSPAQISPLPKTGQRAFVAVQSEHVSGIDSEVVTVVIRQRNVIISVSVSGQESGHGFGPVSVSTLQAGAVAAARDVLAKALTQPTA